MNNGIYWIEGPWSGKLAIITRPRGDDWLFDEMCRLRNNGVDVILSLLENSENRDLGLGQEQVAVEANGMRFFSFSIPDRGVPNSKWSVIELVHDLDSLLSNGKNLAIHCRQGIGRSSMIAAAILALKNVDVNQAFEQIQRSRGVPVPDTLQQREWVEELAHLEKLPVF